MLLSAERTKKEIISEATYNQMFQLLHKLPYACRHVVVLLTVPIVFPGIYLPFVSLRRCLSCHALFLCDLSAASLVACAVALCVSVL